MACTLTILFLLMLVVIVVVSLYGGDRKEYGSNIKSPQHLGLGAYPPGLYGTRNRNTYYNDDLKAVMRYSDDYDAMSGLKFASFDVNAALETGKHGKQKTVDYI